VEFAVTAGHVDAVGRSLGSAWARDGRSYGDGGEAKESEDGVEELHFDAYGCTSV
jgi:hypothetical protein